MMDIQLEGQREAEEIALANMSPRYRRLEWLERWVEGTQYAGKVNWWNDSVPVWERAPCIVYPIVNIGIRSNVDLCLGEGRFPTFSIEHTGEREGSDQTDAETSPVDEFLTHYHRLSRFSAAAREAFEQAQGSGTVVALQGARNGVPFIETIPAKWCERTMDKDGELDKLEIQYPYLDEFRRADGKWAVRAMLYRRVIDRQSDIVYKPAVATKEPVQINWQRDEAASVDHNLGFVPAVWYAFMRGTQPVNVIDGNAIHRWTTDEIHQHDIARSQWHRCALLSEPQFYEIGVQRGYNPTGEGRKAMVPTTEKGGPATPDNPITGHFVESGGRPKGDGARKKGPGYVAQYENENTKVGAITIPADALKAQQDNVSDLRIKIQEALAVVFLDPENIKFAATTSGKALQAIKQKQVDRCSLYREDFRDGFLVPCIIMQLRLAKKLSLNVPGIEEALEMLGDQEFSAPHINVEYGDFYQPDPEEEKQIIDIITTAVDKHLITKKVAVEHVAPIFGIRDTEKLLRELEEERETEDSRELSELRRLGLTNESPGQLPGNPAQA